MKRNSASSSLGDEDDRSFDLPASARDRRERTASRSICGGSSTRAKCFKTVQRFACSRVLERSGAGFACSGARKFCPLRVSASYAIDRPRVEKNIKIKTGALTGQTNWHGKS